jgi:putative restriction endonuclease
VPHLSFTVSVEERRFACEFRERVVRAYQRHCAVCRLRRDELLEAAHIVPDADPLGVPTVRNGVALCTLHHAAFDADLIGITPDYIVEVRRDVLNESDGPMLIHGLQGFHGQGLFVPQRATSQPDKRLLEQRYERFRRRAG